MGKIINLDVLRSRTFEFMFEGEKLNVNQPSYKMIKDYDGEIENGEDALGSQVKLVHAVMNNNTSATSISLDTIESLPMSVINAIMEVIIGMSKDTEEHPN